MTDDDLPPPLHDGRSGFQPLNYEVPPRYAPRTNSSGIPRGMVVQLILGVVLGVFLVGIMGLFAGIATLPLALAAERHGHAAELRAFTHRVVILFWAMAFVALALLAVVLWNGRTGQWWALLGFLIGACVTALMEGGCFAKG